MTPANSVIVDGWSRFDRPQPLASWYAEGLCDTLGDRLLMFDNSGTPSLELLRFRPLLANADGFEDALRERVDALRVFDHRSFPRVRAVERLDGGDLALVSTFTTGKRVSEIFWSPQARTGVHPAFAAWLIRELISSIADLHDQGETIAHAGLSPDRVILTPEGRLVIVEHVLGAALDRLQHPVHRLWEALGLVALEDSGGRAQLDQRTDVIQVAWIALSLLLGRRIPPFEFPTGVGTLLDEFVGAHRGRSAALVSELRRWLESALIGQGDVFESASQAKSGLGGLRMHGGPHAIAFAPTRILAEQPAFEHPRQLPPARPAIAALPTPVPHGTEATLEPARSESSTMATATEFATDVLNGPAPAHAKSIGKPASWIQPGIAGWLVAAALALVAVGEAVWIGRLELARAAVTPPPPPLAVVLNSLHEGDAVIVDGREVGVTPLKLALTQGNRSIQVRTAPSVDADRPATPVVDQQALRAAATKEPPIAARDTRGGLRLSSPIELQVLEGERVLGSSADGPIVTTAGKHELDFLNTALGFRSHQVVDIKAGQIVPMKITPPDGRISVNAMPWAQVSINGNPVGETPLANVPLAVGEYEITFRHPQLGEQTQKVIVKSNALTRASATFSR
jgi:hypothetical protein